MDSHQRRRPPPSRRHGTLTTLRGACEAASRLVVVWFWVTLLGTFYCAVYIVLPILCQRFARSRIDSLSNNTYYLLCSVSHFVLPVLVLRFMLLSCIASLWRSTSSQHRLVLLFMLFSCIASLFRSLSNDPRHPRLPRYFLILPVLVLRFMLLSCIALLWRSTSSQHCLVLRMMLFSCIASFLRFTSFFRGPLPTIS